MRVWINWRKTFARSWGDQMADNTAFHSVMPLIPTGGSLADAVAFYTEKLGFDVQSRWDDGAVIRRGSVSFLLVPNSNREWANNASFSIGVADLDALYAELQSREVTTGRIEVKPWGRREFHLIIPSGVCFHFFAAAAGT